MSFNSGMKGADVVALLKNGLPIVDDVSKLDPNADLGSMASVAIQGNLVETSLRNLYQPDASIIDKNTGAVDTSNCSSVYRIKITAPTAPIPLDGVSISMGQSLYFLGEGASLGGDDGSAGRIAMLAVMPNATLSHIECAMGIVIYPSISVQKEYVLWTMTDDGVITTYQEEIDAFCSAAEGLFYIGDLMSITSGAGTSIEYLNFFDHFAEVVTGVPNKVYIYQKKDSWEELYKEELNKINQKSDVVSNVELENDGGSIYLQPNTYNRYTFSYNNGESLSVVLITTYNPDIYNEYILELTCATTPNGVYFQRDFGPAPDIDIKWANGNEPIFEAGTTYIISIVNRFGVYSTFSN